MEIKCKQLCDSVWPGGVTILNNANMNKNHSASTSGIYFSKCNSGTCKYRYQVSHCYCFMMQCMSVKSAYS